MKVRAAIGAGGSGQFRDLYRLSFQAQKLVWDRLWMERADIIFAVGTRKTVLYMSFFHMGCREILKCGGVPESRTSSRCHGTGYRKNIKESSWSGQGWKLYEAYEKMFSMVGDMIQKIDPPAELADDYRTASIRLRMCG